MQRRPRTRWYPMEHDTDEYSLYTPLDPNLRQIRLLRLIDPAPDGDEINCELAVFPLDYVAGSNALRDAEKALVELEQDPESKQPVNISTRCNNLAKLRVFQQEILEHYIAGYEGRQCSGYIALSYEWGKEPPSHRIQVNGRNFLIRPNLHAFLLAMRRKALWSKWIFIDAICINQGNWDERSSQVELMGEIYLRADEMIAWVTIPDSEPPAEDYFDPLLQFDRYLHVNQDENGQLVLEYSFPENDSGPAAEETSVRQYLSAALKFYESLGRSGYWTRVWTTQELCNARSTRIWCGGSEIDSGNLLTATKKLWPWIGADEQLFQSLPAWYGFKTTAHARSMLEVSKKLAQNYWDQRPSSLAYTFFKFSDNQCSIPHDHIFGILGCTTSRMKPNYAMTTGELFVRAWADILCTFDHASPSVPNYFVSGFAKTFGIRELDPAFVYCGSRVLDAHEMTKSQKKLIFSIIQNPNSNDDENLFVKLFWAVPRWYCELRIRKMKMRKGLVTLGPDDKSGKTLAEWDEYIDKVVAEARELYSKPFEEWNGRHDLESAIGCLQRLKDSWEADS